MLQENAEAIRRDVLDLLAAAGRKNNVGVCSINMDYGTPDENVRAMLSSLEVKMQPDFSATREVVMNESNGDLTRIIFRRERRDVKLPPGTFDQTKPLDMTAIRAEAGDGK